MAELAFRVLSASTVPHALTPQLALTLVIENRPDEQEIHSVLLRCQVQIAAAERRYGIAEEEGLLDLFGAPTRFAQTMRNLLWTHSHVLVPPFRGATTVELPLLCSYDFNLAATKLLYALGDGEVPLMLLFGGTVFYQGACGLQVAQIASTCEARFALPVHIWQKTMAHYYPDWAPLSLRKDVFDRLYRYKQRLALRTFEEVVERLLVAEERA
jgi:hypothetical protein